MQPGDDIQRTEGPARAETELWSCFTVRLARTARITKLRWSLTVDWSSGPLEGGSRVTSVSTAPVFAVSPDCRDAIAWASPANGGVEGRVHVSMRGLGTTRGQLQERQSGQHGRSSRELTARM